MTNETVLERVGEGRDVYVIEDRDRRSEEMSSGWIIMDLPLAMSLFQYTS